MIKSENTPSEPQKPSIIEKIQELKHMCVVRGRTPIVLLINRANYATLENTLSSMITFAVPEPSKARLIGEFLNLQLIINDKVTDFAIVDDRHWFEQKF